MNKIFFILFCYFFSFNLQAQSVVCGERSMNVTDLECVDGHLLFTVTADNLGSSIIENLPDGFNVTPVNMIDDASILGNTTAFLQPNGGGGIYNFNVPSLGCAPLNLTVYLFYQQVEDCNYSNLIISYAPAPIPTLSQWMIAILAFLITIFGVLGIRSTWRKKVEA